jgi:hypothetical protein
MGRMRRREHSRNVVRRIQRCGAIALSILVITHFRDRNRIGTIECVYLFCLLNPESDQMSRKNKGRLSIGESVKDQDIQSGSNERLVGLSSKSGSRSKYGSFGQRKYTLVVQ